MIFIIGGSDQGKRAFARETLGLSEGDFLICSEDTREIDFGFRCIAHIERFALGCVRRGESPEDYWRAHLDRLGDKVLIAKYAGTEVKVDGEECVIVRQSDILAVVE